MTDAQQRAAAKAFAKNWKDRGYEKGDSQIFWVKYHSLFPLRIRYILITPVLLTGILRKLM